jgi:hypothetical protein
MLLKFCVVVGLIMPSKVSLINQVETYNCTSLLEIAQLYENKKASRRIREASIL